MKSRHGSRPAPEHEKYARAVGAAVGAAKVGASARTVRRHVAAARAALDHRAEVLAGLETDEAMAEGIAIDHLHDALDALLEDGYAAAIAVMDKVSAN